MYKFILNCYTEKVTIQTLISAVTKKNVTINKNIDDLSQLIHTVQKGNQEF